MVFIIRLSYLQKRVLKVYFKFVFIIHLGINFIVCMPIFTDHNLILLDRIDHLDEIELISYLLIIFTLMFTLQMRMNC